MIAELRIDPLSGTYAVDTFREELERPLDLLELRDFVAPAVRFQAMLGTPGVAMLFRQED